MVQMQFLTLQRRIKANLKEKGGFIPSSVLHRQLMIGDYFCCIVIM